MLNSDKQNSVFVFNTKPQFHILSTELDFIPEVVWYGLLHYFPTDGGECRSSYAVLIFSVLFHQPLKCRYIHSSFLMLIGISF